MGVRGCLRAVPALAALLVVAATASASGTGRYAGCNQPGGGVASTTTKGELFYTRYGAPENLKRLPFSYDGKSLFLAKAELIGKGVPRADGLLFVPDGDILVGGVSDIAYKVDPKTGKYTSKKGGGNAVDHLALDPSGEQVYATGIPGPISVFPLKPFSDATRHDVSGDDRAVTGIAFDACKNAYYSSGGSGGRGYFGRLDLTTFTTKRLIKAVVPAAHGLAYDPLTGDIFLFGDSHITQFDTKTQRFVSDLKIDGVTLDQGSADGQGHLFVADNGGNLVFVDYSKTRLVGDKRNVVVKQFLDTTLDDIAPLSGLGAGELPPPIVSKAVNVEPKGKVMLRLPGTNRFVPLERDTQVPTGSEIDATKGRVTLTSALPGGKTQSADFFQGRFIVTQPAKAGLYTELTLTGPLAPCPRCRVPKGAAAPPKERHLWGKGKGKFRTKGKHASATVRGTSWLTQDFADRTYVRVTQGTVDVYDKKKRKHVIVKAHRSYVAKR